MRPRALLRLVPLLVATGAAAQSTRLDSAEVRVVARVRPETVYVGQATQYELSVFIRNDVRRRLRRNPEYVPPELRGLVGYDYRDRDSVVRVTQAGVEYEVHRFTRTLFPVAAGSHEVAAARLSYALPLGASFFSREESRTLRSEAVAVTAIEPPLVGRPATWDGAVGDLTVSVAPLPTSVRRGDPFVLTVRVEGRGHVPMVPRPRLEIPWASTVASDERVRYTVAERALRGTKEFDWLVTPSSDGTFALPVIEYAVFDPQRRAYRIARTAAAAVQVSAATVPVSAAERVEVPPTRRESAVPLRRWAGETARLPGTAWWYWLLVGIAPIPALVRRVRDRARRPSRRGAAASLGTLTEQATAAERRAALHAVLAERFAATALPWETTDRAIAVLRREGVTPTSARTLSEIVAALDACCYGATAAAPPSVAAIRRALTAVVREARPRPRSRGGTWRRATVLVVTVAASLSAQGHVQSRTAFDAGRALADRDPAAAADSFFSAARRAPRAAAAWHNAATTSWVIGDTARAVVGWQRVARLAPLDDGAGRSLRRLGAWRAAPPASIWELPVSGVALAALALWCVGWGLLLRRAHGRLAWASVTTAVALGGLAIHQQHRLDDPRVGVIARPSPLRPLPALAADGGLLALTGEVVWVREATPVWLHIDAADGRRGWVDARDVLTLDARPWRD